MPHATAHIGTSGWSYPSWRGDFYPRGLPHREELRYLTERLTSVEVNATFYGLQRPSTFRTWAEQVQAPEVLALKGSRYISHLKRLRDVDQALANFWASGALELGHRLGPVLWQLPARTELDPATLERFLELLPRSTAAAAELARRHDDRVPEPSVTASADLPIRYAVEARHESFGSAAAQQLLREHDVATVFADGAGLPSFDARTADFRYVRLHGRPRLYRSGYGEAVLDRWASRIGGWLADGEDVYVYFDNDAAGHAPHDAERLLQLLADKGFERTSPG